MYQLAFAMILLTQLGASACAAFALLGIWQDREGTVRFVEKGHIVVTGALIVSSSILLRALYVRDYGLEYVRNYTDNFLSLFYQITAFWAGQPGSMLFWALSVAVMGSLFALTARYRSLPGHTKLWYWTFFYIFMAFFALLLAVWQNPFVMVSPAPADGNGLNPLLQNPGMIIHPPLLFIGYGGFTVPACLALAQMVTGNGSEEIPWHVSTRPIMIIAWSFLTAGILLGAWWAYMELGWGGYWAWDPVENASLIPWLFATATLHTILIERRSGKLSRTNTLLITLTTLSGFFATYLVRSGVIDSVHAFGEGAVGTPLLIFVISSLAVTLGIVCASRRTGEQLGSPVSREGTLTFMTWILIALAIIILTATMWPVISKLWSSAPQGLDASFYNKVCLPLGTILVILLAICPWLGWTGCLTDRSGATAGIVLAAGVLILLKLTGYGQLHPMLATGAAAAACIAMLWVTASRLLHRGGSGFGIAAAGCHLGLALCVIGVAFSGSYKIDRDIILVQGGEANIGGYTLSLKDVREGRGPGYDFLVATIDVSRDGASIGRLAPEKRAYDKFGSMVFTEVDVIPSLGEEVYASLTGTRGDRAVVAKVSVEPAVNWLWIGGIVMTLFPLFGIQRRKNGAEQA